MPLAIVGQVGDAVPLPSRPGIRVGGLGRRCLLQTNIGQVRVLQAEKVFELSISCCAGESYLSGRYALVSCPAHAEHLALPSRAAEAKPWIPAIDVNDD